MDNEKYKRSVKLACPTCGSSQLETGANIADLDEMIRCPSCDREMRKDELIRENRGSIDANIDEMEKEITKDIEKEMNFMLQKAFKGNKNIRIK